MKWAISGFVFLFIVTLIFWLTRYLELRRKQIKERIEKIETREWNESVHQHKVYETLSNLFNQLKWVRFLEERLQNELKKANILMKSRELIILIFFSFLIGSAIGILISGGSLNRGIWLGWIGMVIPLIWIRMRKNQRKAKLDGQLPEMITMTANSLKAGYSLLQSFELLSREMPKPLSEEIQRLLQEMRLGVTTEQALTNFNRRLESADLDLIITAMLIQRQIGGNLAEILDTIGITIRERIRIQGEIRSLTAQGRMSMFIFMILPIGLAGFLFLSNPDYMMPLILDPIGWLMISLAVAGQITGAIIIKKIIQIEV